MQKVLIVEDDPVLQQLYKDVFQEAGYYVVIAGDGEQGLSAAASEHPDIMLLDIMLPKKDGLSTLRDLKSNPDLENIPVALLTALPKGAPLINDIDLISKTVGYWVKDDYTPGQLVELVKNELARIEEEKKILIRIDNFIRIFDNKIVGFYSVSINRLRSIFGHVIYWLLLKGEITPSPQLNPGLRRYYTYCKL